jgi:hypothetical protein
LQAHQSPVYVVNVGELVSAIDPQGYMLKESVIFLRFVFIPPSIDELDTIKRPGLIYHLPLT